MNKAQITQALRIVSGHLASTGCEGETGYSLTSCKWLLEVDGNISGKAPVRQTCDSLTSWQTAPCDWFVGKHVAIVVRSLDESNKFIYKHSLATLQAIMNLWKVQIGNWDHLRFERCWVQLFHFEACVTLSEVLLPVTSRSHLQPVGKYTLFSLAGWVYHVQYTGHSLTNDVEKS